MVECDQRGIQEWLARHGCTFEPGKGGHLKVCCMGRASVLPVHGSAKKLKKGTMEAIKKQLRLR